MSFSSRDCCVLNAGSGAWAFGQLASQWASFLEVDVSESPRQFNYLLSIEESHPIDFDTFIPIESLRLASDKRLLAKVFLDKKVQTPRTILCDTFDEVRSLIRESPEHDWCLKYPTSCGANGHRLLMQASDEPRNWPRPFIVQEFIRLERPEVYRTYCAGGELFGWVVRRFPEDMTEASPWVAHAQGARYVVLDNATPDALGVAGSALEAAELWNSFGCVDLIRRPSGEWLVLEVGTDGLFNHVDRDIGSTPLERELGQRIARSFREAAARSNNSRNSE